jgi:putative hydrolase of the HAD superfamily
MLRAALFDMGGPLDTEVTHERLRDDAIRAELVAAGYEVSDTSYAAAARWAVESFASNAYQAIIWRLCPDRAVAERVYRSLGQYEPPELFELRDGIPELLSELRERGLRLGLVANQPARARLKLERASIRQYFDHLGISAVAGLHKPDPRLFLAVCDALQVAPQDCVMVGDRIDNDVVPARLLGMRTILLRAGRHVDQQPRTWHEVPDAEVHDVAGMRAAILSLLAQG